MIAPPGVPFSVLILTLFSELLSSVPVFGLS